MNIRETTEKWEREYLSPYASLSENTRGRDREEPLCDIRPEYQRDRDRILHSKSFRRLKHKTQVFLAPEGDHYRTRLTHTLEVSQIARTIAKALRLNESLTEAIALGHDLGHTPFGHSGEAILDKLCSGGFAHYKQSVRVVEVLEKKGRGINLTWEVRDGILNHRNHRPAQIRGKCPSHNRNNRCQGISQGMLNYNGALCDSLGLADFDKIIAENLEHGSSRSPGNRSCGTEADRNHRSDKPCKMLLRRQVKTYDRNQLKLNSEYNNKH